MSFKDQFNTKNKNKSKQKNEQKTPSINSNQHNVEFAEEAAREAGLSLKVYEQNKPQ